jgi:hypothetical protein
MKFGSQLKDALKALGLGAPKRHEPSELASGGVRPGPLAPNDNPAPRPPGRPQPEVRRELPQLRRASPAPTQHRPMPGSSRPATPPPAARKPSVGVRPLPPVAEPPRPVTRLARIDTFRPHPLFQDDPGDDAGLPALANRGIERQLNANPDNETDLIVGLDFGTSATKVVIRDPFAATGVFPVRLNGGRPGIDGHLLPSRVFRTGDAYSLTQGTHRITDLKLRLLACKAKSPVTEFNDCCAFLAFVIRRARGCLLSEQKDIYGKHALNWRLNLGLAARSYQDGDTVTLFRRLAWAAANLAADPEAESITVQKADQYRLESLAVSAGSASEGVEFGWADVDAVPEVSAQLQGFMSSARWDWRSRPVMMLVDVGAGTVDSALFHVQVPQDGKGVLTFYSSRVDSNGAMNLHRARVDWLQALMPVGSEHAAAAECLAAIAKPTDRLRPIPESVRDYLPGYEIEVVGRSIDEDFGTGRYRTQVAGSINDAKVGKGIPASQLERVPLLLCGGGSRMKFYGSIGEAINGTSGWHVSVEVMRLPVPQDLVDTGWHADDFDRLSVAYGLSLAGNGETTLGSIVRAIDVPEVQPYCPPKREDNYVSKDQM